MEIVYATLLYVRYWRIEQGQVLPLHIDIRWWRGQLHSLHNTKITVCSFILVHLKDSYVAYSHYSNFVLYQYTSTTLLQQFCRLTFYYSFVWHNNKIINLYFNCKEVASTSVLPFCIFVVLPDVGHNYRSQHVVGFMMNKRICSLLECRTIRRISKPTLIKQIQRNDDTNLSIITKETDGQILVEIHVQGLQSGKVS
jgi:hypothetical protein